jgi:putative amino-acid transport system ATP-binding protein
MIDVQNLSKKFGKNQILSDITFDVKEGEVVAIIGASGSGKSTLLRCLNLLEKPNSGIITIGDITLDANGYSHKNETALRRQSAMVFQNFNLFKNKTALENITEALITVKKIAKNRAIQIGKELLESMGLSAQTDQYPITLSGGQQQRVAIARALALKPKVILFDEPTSALDPERVGEVLEVIYKLAKEKTTMIIVTHEMDFAKKVADKIIFMEEGNIIEQGVASQILDTPESEKLKRFLRRITDRVDYNI